MAGQQRGKGAQASTKKKILVISGLVLLLLLAAGGSALLLNLGTTGSGEPAATANAPQTPAQAIYLPLEPAFLTNYTVHGRMRYLQLSVTAMARDQVVIDTLQKHMPLVRNRIVMLLGGQEFETLQTAEGREQLQQAMLKAVQETIEQELGRPGVEQLLFTNYVMQ
ncbi:MAG: flagellar basal body-associated FliL family protein [Spongiibacteraceae bacterium]|jgi:flagellar FliL protein|nr:flagellar basal body-associated FliL family protein [Spongiibacteraceae bacterium]